MVADFTEVTTVATAIAVTVTVVGATAMDVAAMAIVVATDVAVTAAALLATVVVADAASLVAATAVAVVDTGKLLLTYFLFALEAASSGKPLFFYALMARW